MSCKTTASARSSVGVSSLFSSFTALLVSLGTTSSCSSSAVALFSSCVSSPGEGRRTGVNPRAKRCRHIGQLSENSLFLFRHVRWNSCLQFVRTTSGLRLSMVSIGSRQMAQTSSEVQRLLPVGVVLQSVECISVECTSGRPSSGSEWSMFMLGTWISESSTTSLRMIASGVLGDSDEFGAIHDMPRSRRIVPGLSSISSCAIRWNRSVSSPFMSAFGDLGGEAAPGLGSTSMDAILEHTQMVSPA